MTPLERTDQIAADLVCVAYANQGVLSVVLRMDNDKLRIIAPDLCHEALTLMLYRAADELASHASRIKLGDLNG